MGHFHFHFACGSIEVGRRNGGRSRLWRALENNLELEARLIEEILRILFFVLFFFLFFVLLSIGLSFRFV